MAGIRTASTYRTRDLTQAILGAARAGYLIKQIEITSEGTIRVYTDGKAVAVESRKTIIPKRKKNG